MTKPDPKLNFKGYTPRRDDPCAMKCQSELQLKPDEEKVILVKPKNSESWLVTSGLGRESQFYVREKVDFFTLTLREDGFGCWFEVEESRFRGSVNQGESHHGFAFIGGELYELGHSALFYGEDYSPNWSPVTYVSDQYTAQIVKLLTRKDYPVMKCDGTDKMEFDLFLRSKEEQGFIYNRKEEAFYSYEQYPFTSSMNKHVYSIINLQSKGLSVNERYKSLARDLSIYGASMQELFTHAPFEEEVKKVLSLANVLPNIDILSNLNVVFALALEQQKKRDLEQKQRAIQDRPKKAHLEYYHGGKAWLGDFELGVKKSGGMEHGPGLYLTNGIETAKNYARGGGIVQKISVNANARLIDNVTVPLSDMVHFLKVNGIRNAKKITEDLESNAARMGRDQVDLEVLVNLMINYKSLTPSAAKPLNEFIKSQGVDFAVFKAPMWASHGQGSDEWVVVYNPDVIVSKEKVDMKHFDWSETHLPPYKEQLQHIQSADVTPSNAPAMTAPKSNRR